MPILFVVKRSRPRLFLGLQRLVARPGLVSVVLERRRPARRAGQAAIAFAGHRGLTLRQPLDRDSARTWDELGFLVVRVRDLPAARPAARPPSPRSPRRRPASRGRSAGRPATRRTRPRTR